MNSLTRYRRGESEAVWQELVALGDEVRKPRHLADATAVAVETMRRVRRNIQTLRRRLEKDEAYQFEDPAAAHVPPAADASDVLDRIETAVGPMPLSLRAFYEVVGSVDFRQSRTQHVNSSHKQRGAAHAIEVLGEEDPLQVAPLSELAALVEGRSPSRGSKGCRGVYFCFAADEFHKANYSGGENYHVTLPNAAADFQIEGMYGIDEYFVQYLRQSFRYGGFRGRVETLESDEDQCRKAPPTLDVVKRLAKGLVAV